MAGRVDYVRKKFASLQAKTLRTALAHEIQTQFPRIGGPKIRALCAELLLDVLERHLRPREHVRHGQVVWMAIRVDDPPRFKQRVSDVRLVPVVLDLSTAEDVDARIDRCTTDEQLCRKAVRLCEQAYEQAGVLSNCDLAELLCVPDSRIASVLSSYERRTGRVVPRRATIHDVGTGVTHKRIICRKRYLEGKSTQQIARETHHGPESVDRYLGHYDRVRHCRQEGLDVCKTAHALGCSQWLVEEYLRIDDELIAADD